MTTVLNGYATAGRAPALDDYLPLLGRGEIDGIRALARPLRDRTVQMVNSTAVGGGVAEILNRLVPLALDLDIQIRWDVMDGGADFFRVTKAFHNALHGDPYRSEPDDFEIFLSFNARNRDGIALDSEFVVVHDPQPVGARRRASGSRRPLDLAVPHRPVAPGRRPSGDSSSATSPGTTPRFSRRPPSRGSSPCPQYLFYPSIDPLADKNRPLDDEVVGARPEALRHRSDAARSSRRSPVSIA